MRRRSLTLGLLGLVGVLAVVSTGSAASPPTWGNAIEVRGTAALNSGGQADVYSVSCATAGTCAAGGSYTDGSGHAQAFVADETNGSWSNAIEAPGTAALNAGGNAHVNSVSCPTPGYCAAGGFYTDGSGHAQALVGDETNGSWSNAIEAPGTASLNSGGQAAVNSVACATAGSCAAGGYYTDGLDHAQAFVVNETNGSWGTAVQVPGTAILNGGGNARVNAVSCATAGNCAAAGFYTDAVGHAQAFVVDETNGSWGNAVEVPGTATLNSGGSARVNAVSCPTAGNCTAGGFYTIASGLSGHPQAFVVDQTNGSWGTAIEAPGTATLNSGGKASVQSVSCATGGNCAAGGYYTDRFGHVQAFVVEETSGSWSTNAVEVPGTATLNSGGNASVRTVSCATAGNCAAGGSYTDHSGKTQAYVVEERSAGWGSAVQVPGTATLNSGGNAHVSSISCAAAGNCTAGGSYADGSGKRQALVVGSDTTPPRIKASVSPASPNGLNGWYTKSPVAITWSAFDHESGIASSVGCGPTTMTANTSVHGRKLTCTAKNGAGLRTTKSVTIKLDATPPTLTCAAPPHFVLDATKRSVHATVNDGNSGPALSTVSAMVGTHTPGQFSTKLTGTDKAGNTGSASCRYIVGVNVSLSSPPAVSQYSRLSTATIPVVFTLTNVAGAPISTTLTNDISTHCDATVRIAGHGGTQCAQAAGKPGKFSLNLTHSTLPAAVYTVKVSISYGGVVVGGRARSVRLK